MRAQYCRKHIDKAAVECGLSDETVREVKKAADFCDQYFPEISGLNTNALRPLIREKDKIIRDTAISAVENLLNRETPTGGTIKKKLTGKEVKLIVERAKREIWGEEGYRFESLKREIKRQVVCPKCGHPFIPEKPGKPKKPKTTLVTEEEHTARKASIAGSLNLDSELGDLNSEYDRTLTPHENRENIRRTRGISKEPDLARIKHESREHYEVSDEEIEALSGPLEVIHQKRKRRT